MGSLVYAKRCKACQDKIVAMLSLETLGYYDDAPGSQTYPIGLLDRIYPIQGNFISFVGNIASAALVRRVVGTFRAVAQFPSEAAILPNAVAGAGWSDHWSFWQQGYPALMVTDTAPFRYPHYHTLDDTPDKLDYDRFARVVTGLEAVIQTLING
jgi:Zn-dependent M28 family amino/carboxypeptidase